MVSTKPAVVLVAALCLIGAQAARSQTPSEARAAEVLQLAQGCDRARADFAQAAQEVERARGDWRNLMVAAPYLNPYASAATADAINARGSFWANRLASSYSVWRGLQARFQVSLTALLADLQGAGRKTGAPPPAAQQPQPDVKALAYLLGARAFQRYQNLTDNLVRSCTGGNEEACSTLRSRGSQNDAYIRYVDGLAASKFTWTRIKEDIDMINEPSRHDSD